MRRVLSLLALSLVTAACGACEPAAKTSPPVDAKASAPVDARTSLAVTEPPITPPPSSADLAGLARSDNAFAVDLYGKLRARKGNLAISPMSLATALTMTWAGARGETAAQMKKVLHAEGTAAQAADVAGKLIGSYRDPVKKVTLRVANRLFGERSYTFEPSFLELTRAAFGAPIEPIDFKHDAEGGRRLINGWVAGQTQDRIKDLVPAGAVTPDTRLVLTNAIYFLGDWAQPFRKEATSPAAFHVTAADSKNVPTMHQKESFRFAAADGVHLLEMPYVGGELALMVVLPDAVDGLDAVEQRLTSATLDGWIGGLRAQEVDVSLPRFEIDPAESLPLAEPLKALGMSLALDPDHADLTGIANPPNPADRLYVSQVLHKAFVKIDEKGTEAAAATAVVMAVGGAAPAPATAFRADHPFLFLLRDLRSGTILFLGRVSDPAVK